MTAQQRHTATMSDLVPDPRLRGLFLGSGGGLVEPNVAERVIDLTGQAAADTVVLYLGTASYDRSEPRTRQAARFGALGCVVEPLEVATRTPPTEHVVDLIGRADVVVASGGNTLFAVDRWRQLGIDRLLRDAIDRGVVLCGGSAGAICWFDGGHSDSMDPTSYLDAVPADDPRATTWRYIRVDGLGVMPGLLCPHFDRTQSNGVRRADDFERIMLEHGGETGLGLDEWAGLVVDGGSYEVVFPEGREGSVADGRFVSDGSGIPGLWLKEVSDGSVVTWLAPRHGSLHDILRPARSIEPDPLVEVCRAQNPSNTFTSLR